MDALEELQKENKELKQKINVLEQNVSLYEQNGSAKLFYSLNRKLNEIADMLNAVFLKNIDIASKQDVSFERVFKLLEKSESISAVAKSLGDFAGVSGDESKDTQSPKYRMITTPESIANGLGKIAGKND